MTMAGIGHNYTGGMVTVRYEDWLEMNRKVGEMETEKLQLEHRLRQSEADCRRKERAIYEMEMVNNRLRRERDEAREGETLLFV